jgi:hypothetical protein
MVDFDRFDKVHREVMPMIGSMMDDIINMRRMYSVRGR